MLKIKIITGFREDQYFIIDIEECHKAYYLFNNPEKRGVFENGVALTGKTIQGIEPAYNEIMGWNPTHKLDDDDWNEIRAKKINIKMRDLLQEAKIISYLVNKNPDYMKKKLSDVKQLRIGKKIWK